MSCLLARACKAFCFSATHCSLALLSDAGSGVLVSLCLVPRFPGLLSPEYLRQQLSGIVTLRKVGGWRDTLPVGWEAKW